MLQSISEVKIKSIGDLEGLNWSEKKWVEQVDAFVEYTAIPNQTFWYFYKANKATLKQQGISVSKYRTGEWEIVRYTSKYATTEEEETEEPVIIPSDMDLTPLYDYQQIHAVKLMESMKKHGVAVDNSDTGTGKTYSALVVCRELGLNPIVICPKAVIPAWERSAKTIGVEVLTIVNYELIRVGKMREYYTRKDGRLGKKKVPCPWITVEKNEHRQKYDHKWLITWDLPENAVIIFDEAHRCKNPKPINTQLMTEAANADVKILMLSATIGESPLKMFGVARALDFYRKPWEFYSWIQEYECSKDRFGWQFIGGSTTMKKLRKVMKPYMSGMNVAELIEQGKFPESVIFAEAYDMNSDADQIQKIWDACGAEIDELERKQGRLPPQAVLAIMQKARQKAELYKVPTMVEMANDLLEEGHSVAIFVNYTATLKKFCEMLKTDCVIYGGTANGRNAGAENEQNRLDFQANKERVIVCNVAAAKEGIDLHDVHHKFPRVSLITPDWNAQNLKQVLGRVQRFGGTNSQQRIIFAANTIEEQVCEKVRAKLNNIEALNKGDLAIYDIF